ncbi:MAG: metallophosphoesterase [Chlorobiota bacterium]
MRWALFIVVLALLQGVIDAYVLWHWMRWVQKQRAPSWLYRIAWGIAAVMFITAIAFFAYRRWAGPTLTPEGAVVYALLTLWYLPKMLLFPVLLFGSFVGWVRRRWSRWWPQSVASAVDPQRRQVLSLAGLGIATLPFLAVAEGMARTTYRPRLFTTEIPIPGLAPELDGLRIVHLSDIHAGSFSREDFFWQVVEQVQQLGAELIVFTGDYVNFHPDELRRAEAPLRQLSAPFGVYGCLGNHDHYMTDTEHRRLRNRLERLGIELLVNEGQTLTVRGVKLQLAGTDNTGSGQRFGDLDRALAGLSSEAPTILLFHDPRFWEREVEGKAPVALGLCGHTHGGQVGLQLLGQEWSVAQLVYRYWAGLYQTGQQWLYVNRGLGFVGPAVRMGIPPEIALLILRRA